MMIAAAAVGVVTVLVVFTVHTAPMQMVFFLVETLVVMVARAGSSETSGECRKTTASCFSSSAVELQR